MIDSESMKNAIKQALSVRNNSHSPYSHFAVGAAVVTESGAIFVGTNVENASYGATMCAERVALFSAVSAGEKKFSFLVVAAEMDGEAVYPCGLCRQVLSEFSSTLPIILVNSQTGQVEVETTLDAIFPHQFSLDS